MKKRSGYLVLALAAAIYILYNFIVTCFIVAGNSSEELNMWKTFIAELLVFIPVGIFFITIQKLYQKKRWLFTSFTPKTVIIHLFLLLSLIAIHSVWQVYFNSVFLGVSFIPETVIRDVMGFLSLRVLIYIISIGLTVGIVKIQEAEKGMLEQSELKLRLQKTSFRELELKLNPEIIYPNLHFIKNNVHTKPGEASDLILNLSNQLRVLIDNINDERIPLKQDLQFFEYYMRAVQLRLDKKLATTTDVYNNLLDTEIPSLVLLVPFLEDIFFGRYADFTGSIEHVIYKAKPIEQQFIQLALEFSPVERGSVMEKELKGDRHLNEINKLFDAHEDILLQTSIINSRLLITLKINIK